MFSDPGFLAIVIIFALWIAIIFLGLLVGFMPRSWRQKPSGKLRVLKQSRLADGNAPVDMKKFK